MFILFNFWVYFSFSHLCSPNIQPGLCSFHDFVCFCLFLFVDKANRLLAIIFNLVSKFAASQCFHGNFHIAGIVSEETVCCVGGKVKH